MPERADHFLILGGTAEAIKLAKELTAKGNAKVITSLAGRTKDHAQVPGMMRIGGFGGVAGLVSFLLTEQITHVFDATHPFAMQISAHAAEACRQTGIPLTSLTRAAWEKQADDHWIEVETLSDAASTLPQAAVVFLALGRQYINVFAYRRDCRFVLRMVDPPDDPLPFMDATLILGKAQTSWEAEQNLLQTHGITHLVARNSGGEAGYGKIIAARRLGLPVIMIGRKTS